MRYNNKTRLGVCLGAISASLLITTQVLACGHEENAEKVEVEAADKSAAAAIEPAPAQADSTVISDIITGPDFLLSSEDAIIGIASFYEESQQTASGERYDPNAFTAAAQLAIRHKFGGVRFGRLYQPAYALAEYEKKKIILKINDVGPLRPGRIIDLSRAAMAYFADLDKGLLPGFKVTPLPLGQEYAVGPVTDAQLAMLGFAESDIGFVPMPTQIAQTVRNLAAEVLAAPPVAATVEPVHQADTSTTVVAELGDS